MKRVLVVDDDAGALRALARLITARYRGVEVLTAVNGRDAIDTLEHADCDLVLTDLQMPGLNGFELMAWILNHRPQIKVLPMTAYASPEATERLVELGRPEFLTKPIDLEVLSHVLSDALNPGMSGFVQNIGLPSFLQLVELEKKTCTLTIRGDGGSGTLHVDRGQLLDAETRDLRGDEAALEIVMWRDAEIRIEEFCRAAEQTVQRPLGFILMEAARLQDERQHTESRQVAREESGFFRAIMITSSDAESDEEREELAARSLRHLVSGDGVRAGFLVAAGTLLATAGELPNGETLAAGAWSVYEAKARVVADLGLNDQVEDVLITTPDGFELLHPLPRASALLVVVMDRDAVPALVRMKVAATERQLSEAARAVTSAQAADDFLGF